MRTPEAAISSLFPGLTIPDLKSRFNIAPTQQVACVRNNGESNEVVELRWGLVPSWAKDLKIGARMINARSETVEAKPSFRSAFKKRRCLVVADGYFEWKKMGKEKQPFYMTVADGNSGFCMAGLWESWRDKQSETIVETCTVLTTDSNSKLAAVHDRMPVVLDRADFEYWLDPTFQSVQKLKSLMPPKPDDFFKVTAVDKIVNNVRNDSQKCVQEVDV